MRIKQMLIDNFKGIEHLELNPDGKNIEIVGQNGTGKTSVYLAYAWVMSADRIDVSPINPSSLVTSVVVRFDNGLSLGRNFNKKKNEFFIDGDPTTESKYKSYLQNLTKNVDIRIFSRLGFFCEMSLEGRRDILISLCNLQNSDIIAKYPQFQNIIPDIEKFGVKDFEQRLKSRLKLLKDNLQGIPFEIKGLEFQQLRDFDKNSLISNLDSDKKSLEDVNSEIEKLKSVDITRIQRLNQYINTCNLQIQNLDIQLEKLRDEYRQLSQKNGDICPTCGQSIPHDSFIIKRNERISQINSEGKSLSESKKKFQTQLQKFQDEIQQAQNNCDLSRHGELLAQAFQKKLQLECSIVEAENQLAQEKDYHRRQKRIAELNNLKIQHENDIDNLNIKLALLSDFQQTKCHLLEDDINSKFKFVKFKLFDFFKTTGEIKNSCEVLLDGKPYNSALSHGEKVKAALD